MTKLWCTLWNTFLNMFTSVIDGVGYALVQVAEVAGDLLSTVIDGVGDATSSLLSKPVLLIGVGIGAWWLLGRSNDNKDGAK